MRSPRSSDNFAALGILYGSAAIKKSGLSHELISHMTLLVQHLKVSLVLQPIPQARLNRPGAPKSADTKTKTSNHGFFRGYIAAESRFTRLDREGNPIGYDRNDEKERATADESRLTLPLYVGLTEIQNVLAEGGDLELCKIGKNRLYFTYRKNRGPVGFHGQFYIDMNEGNENVELAAPVLPQQQHKVEHSNSSKNRPKSLTDAIIRRLKGKVFKVFIIEDSKTGVCHEAKIIGKVPQLLSRYQQAIYQELLQKDNHQCFEQFDSLIKKVLSAKSIVEIHAALKMQYKDEKSFELFFHNLLTAIAEPIISDLDGIIFGHPSTLPESFRQQFNTNSSSERDQQRSELLKRSIAYFNYERKKVIATLEAYNHQKLNTLLGQLLSSPLQDDAVNKSIIISQLRKAIEHHQIRANPIIYLYLTINNFGEIVHNDALNNAGCITPFEFVNQQIINYTHSLPNNDILGVEVEIPYLQAALQQGLQQYFSDNEKQRSIDLAIEKAIRFFKRKHKTSQPELSEVTHANCITHLKLHLKFAIKNRAHDWQHYQIPHPDYDHYVHHYFQHGFAMRNPNSPDCGGAWFMIDADGFLLYGENQTQLTQVMLRPGYLEQNRLDVSPLVEMEQGWGDIVRQQIILGQSVPQETLASFKKYITNSIKEYIDDLETDDVDQLVKHIETKVRSENKKNKPVPICIIIDALILLNPSWLSSTQPHGNSNSVYLQKLYMQSTTNREQYLEQISQLQSRQEQLQQLTTNNRVKLRLTINRNLTVMSNTLISNIKGMTLTLEAQTTRSVLMHGESTTKQIANFASILEDLDNDIANLSCMIHTATFSREETNHQNLTSTSSTNRATRRKSFNGFISKMTNSIKATNLTAHTENSDSEDEQHAKRASGLFGTFSK